MPIVVEDGTGKTDANSFASTAYADAYFGDRQIQAWASLTTPVKEAALIKATDYIVLWFSTSFKGVQKTEEQALPFPRTGTGLPTEMPAQLLKATCEYAVRAASAPLNDDVVVDGTGQVIQKLVERVGPIEDETTYHVPSELSFVGKRRPIPAADGLMKFLLRNTGGGVIRN
jgi:hypothetical protein